MRTLHDSSCRSELQRRLEGLPRDATRHWGRMSVSQMLWHVSEGLQLALGQLPATKERPPLPRGLMKFVALRFPWPKGAPTMPNLVAKEEHDFAAERARCLQLIDEFAQRPIEEAWPDHPIFGKISGPEVSRLQAKHLDHHLRQFGA